MDYLYEGTFYSKTNKLCISIYMGSDPVMNVNFTIDEFTGEKYTYRNEHTDYIEGLALIR